jgi:hypothetical protein
MPSATFIDKSLSGACAQTDTCAKNLRVLNSGNGINPSMDVKRRFYDTYRYDAEMKRADAVLCFHPSAMCELFMELPPRKFVIASTRYEMGRHSPSEWTLWNENLKKIAADPRNIVAANNKYDAEYIRYFTGLDPVIIPSTIDMPDRYAPEKKTFLLATVHGKHAGTLTRQVARQFPTVLPMKTAYPGLYEYRDLCKHLGIVHLPYQTSIMSLFEQYAMGIPVLVPSPEFMWELRMSDDLMMERTWDRVIKNVHPSKSPIPGVNASVPDPNNDVDKAAFLYWVRFADFYLWPGIKTFGSWSELTRLTTVTGWTAESSKAMLTYHKVQKAEMRRLWTKHANISPTCFEPGNQCHHVDRILSL